MTTPLKLLAIVVLIAGSSVSSHAYAQFATPGPGDLGETTGPSDTKRCMNGFSACSNQAADMRDSCINRIKESFEIWVAGEGWTGSCEKNPGCLASLHECDSGFYPALRMCQAELSRCLNKIPVKRR